MLHDARGAGIGKAGPRNAKPKSQAAQVATPSRNTKLQHQAQVATPSRNTKSKSLAYRKLPRSKRRGSHAQLRSDVLRRVHSGQRRRLEAGGSRRAEVSGVVEPRLVGGDKIRRCRLRGRRAYVGRARTGVVGFRSRGRARERSATLVKLWRQKPKRSGRGPARGKRRGKDKGGLEG